MKRNLVPVAEAEKIPGFPVRVTTLRKWRHMKKYPGLFTTLGRKVFIDLDVLDGLFGK